MDELRQHRRAALERQLRNHHVGEIRFDQTSRRLYATDASIYEIEPLGVALPRSVQDLRTLIQVCREHAVPMVPRGGGTSLSGQAVGPGLVIDTSKYLNRILAIEPEARRCRVQPGVVLAQLNAAAAVHGLQFGPDVSTANRATLGGMIGNNSAGAHSLIHRKTVDHVQTLQVMLADGTPARLSQQRLSDLPALASHDAAARLGLAVSDLLLPLRDEIASHFPKILRRVSGYNFPELQAQLDHGVINLAAAVVGSEGTLAFVTEAELNLVPLPKHRGLLVPHFSSLAAALEAVVLCLEAKPAAVELIDQLILDLARENLELRRQMAGIEGRPAALLMVEFSADDSEAVAAAQDRLASRLAVTPGVVHVLRASQPQDCERLWRLREAGLPLLMGLPGDRKPATFVEDTAVPTARLPEYAARFGEILRQHGTSGAFYGHASVGCLHTRPLLNLKQPGDVVEMRAIAAAISDLVLEFGGSLSGEHGDGLARSEWNRKMFGEKIYAGFQKLKQHFDPEGQLNPGKIVNAQPMTENLRLGEDYRPHEPTTFFTYQKHGGLVRHVELCSGTGVCRKTSGGVMCPSYRATREEEHSTRGRANALRWALASSDPRKELRSDELMAVLDLCLSCKACKSECPSNVDLAKLKAEITALHFRDRPRPLSHRLVRHLPQFLAWGARFAPVANRLGRSRLIRWLLQRTVGITSERQLPILHAGHFRRWFTHHRPEPKAGQQSTVLFLDDCFTTYFEPKVGIAAVKLLEAAGHRVERLGICCGRALFSKGMLVEARALIQRQLMPLADYAMRGTPILGVEPSCLLSLVDEWPELVPGPAAACVALNAHLVEDWLAEEGGQKEPLRFRATPTPAVFQSHCHQRALLGPSSSLGLLQHLPALELSALDRGCCGMAGMFGYEHEHFGLSMKIAEHGVLAGLAEHPDATILATGTSCRHQISELTGRPTLHPLEFLAEALDEALASRNSPPTS